MTEKHDYTAAIRRKGLDNTGVTEGHAKSMYHTLGQSTYGIVRLKHAGHTNDTDTGRKVELSIEEIEPVPADQQQYFEQLMRSLHQNRVLTSDEQQLQIETKDDLEPKVEQVLAAQRAHVAGQPHVFEEPAQDAEEPDACVVCGEDFDHDLHLVVPEPNVEPDEDPAEDLVDDEPADVDEHQEEPVPAGT